MKSNKQKSPNNNSSMDNPKLGGMNIFGRSSQITGSVNSSFQAPEQRKSPPLTRKQKAKLELARMAGNQIVKDKPLQIQLNQKDVGKKKALPGHGTRTPYDQSPDLAFAGEQSREGYMTGANQAGQNQKIKFGVDEDPGKRSSQISGFQNPSSGGMTGFASVIDKHEKPNLNRGRHNQSNNNEFSSGTNSNMVNNNLNQNIFLNNKDDNQFKPQSISQSNPQQSRSNTPSKPLSLRSLAETGNGEAIDDEVEVIDHTYFSGVLNREPSPQNKSIDRKKQSKLQQKNLQKQQNRTNNKRGSSGSINSKYSKNRNQNDQKHISAGAYQLSNSQEKEIIEGAIKQLSNQQSIRESLNSRHTSRSSNTISMINYNNPIFQPTINLNVEMKPKKEQKPESKPNIDIEDQIDAQPVFQQSHPQRYPRANNQGSGDDFQNSLNFSKHLPPQPFNESYHDQKRNTIPSSQTQNFQNNFRPGIAKNANLMMSLSKPNSNQSSHAQFKAVGTVNYDQVSKRSKLASTAQRGSDQSRSPGISPIGQSMMNTQSFGGTGTLPQNMNSGDNPSFIGTSQLLGNSIANKNSEATSAPDLSGIDINKLVQVNQQLMLQQQLLLQNKELQEKLNRTDENLQGGLQDLKNYQNATFQSTENNKLMPNTVSHAQARQNRLEIQKQKQKTFNPYKSNSPSPSPLENPTSAQKGCMRGRGRSMKRTIKKIVKKNTYTYSESPDPTGRGDPTTRRLVKTKTHYEITTTKIDKEGNKTYEKKEKMDKQPNVVKDLTNSEKVLQQIRNTSRQKLEKYQQQDNVESNYGVGQKVLSNMKSKVVKLEKSGRQGTGRQKKESLEITNQGRNEMRNSHSTEQTNFSKFSKASGAGFFTSLLNPKNFASLQTLEKNASYSNVYVQTPQGNTTRSGSRKKIIIIRKKKNPDGSISQTRQNIYRDYGDQYAAQHSRRMNSTLDFYRGSAKTLQKIRAQKANDIIKMADGSITINNLLGTREEGTTGVISKLSGANQAPRPTTALEYADKMPAPAQNRLASANSKQKGTKHSRTSQQQSAKTYHEELRQSRNNQRTKNLSSLTGKSSKSGKSKKSGGSRGSKKSKNAPVETFDLQPGVNPSNILSSETQNRRLRQKGKNLSNAVPVAYKDDSDEADASQEKIQNIFDMGKKNKRSHSRNSNNPYQPEGILKSVGQRSNNSRHSRNQSAGGKSKSTGRQQSAKSQKSDNVITPRTLSTNLYTFKLPQKDRVVEVQFINQLIFDNDYNNRKDAIMQPIPPSVGQQKFSIVRNKRGMNKMTPSYYLYLEIPTGKKILVLYAKKMPFTKSSYYLISLQKNKERKNENIKETDNTCLGKLRAMDGDQDKFVLYDNGENFKKKGLQFKELRKEHGTFIYRYEPCNVGNIRKMIILYPSINCIRLEASDKESSAMTNDQVRQVRIRKGSKPGDQKQVAGSSDEDDYDPRERHDQRESSENNKYSVAATSQHQKALGVKGTRDNYGREIPDGKKYLYTYSDWRPTNETDTMLSTFERNNGESRGTKFKIFVDNPPQWNPKTNTYVYDFKGRVTEPSIKNFQLIPEMDGTRNETLNDFVLQFGKRDKDEFILDIQFPLSIYQGFGLALSAFDTD